ncbi:LysR family transcriptional regulator [Oleiphilus messinensis]|uniref:LysR family transcriptional regulator n=1 Tax=Oleiphilus messinensis TaxID=141451 RepID=A0A1Y0I4A0_9GAMM|nr:LysR family transcriptional regulator [Oleiphilus messinensis]ARU55241.1 LysR family transcriptional regulator [Oleiphilus messinensis]
MDTELLKTFLEVNSTRHFGKAAENLYLTQAAVSARIKQLESTLGVPLFTRHRNNLQLTATGEKLISHAETILMAWERARQDVSLKQDQQYVFTMGATTGLWDLLLQDVLDVLHQGHDDLALRAEVHSQAILVRHLMERTIDFALLYDPAKIGDLSSVPVVRTDLILVSTRQDESIESAINRKFVAVDWGLSFNVSFTQLFPDAQPPVLHTSLARIALDFILNNQGTAYLPYRMVQDVLGTRLHKVTGAPVISRQIYGCFQKDSKSEFWINEVLAALANLDNPIEDNDAMLVRV